MSEDNVIKVGVGCMVFKAGKLLLGRRISASHGDGEYTVGGGHVEFGESLTAAAKREIEEEWRIAVTEPQFLCLSNLRQYAGKHYVDVGFTCQWLSGEPQPANEGEFSDWGWYGLDALPAPLASWVQNYVEALHAKAVFFDM